MNKLLTIEKKFVHAVATSIIVGAGWWLAHPEQVTAIVKAYPRASIGTTVAGLILALYTQAKPGEPGGAPPSP